MCIEYEGRRMHTLRSRSQNSEIQVIFSRRTRYIDPKIAAGQYASVTHPYERVDMV